MSLIWCASSSRTEGATFAPPRRHAADHSLISCSTRERACACSPRGQRLRAERASLTRTSGSAACRGELFTLSTFRPSPGRSASERAAAPSRDPEIRLNQPRSARPCGAQSGLEFFGIRMLRRADHRPLRRRHSGANEGAAWERTDNRSGCEGGPKRVAIMLAYPTLRTAERTMRMETR